MLLESTMYHLYLFLSGALPCHKPIIQRQINNGGQSFRRVDDENQLHSLLDVPYTLHNCQSNTRCNPCDTAILSSYSEFYNFPRYYLALLTHSCIHHHFILRMDSCICPPILVASHTLRATWLDLLWGVSWLSTGFLQDFPSRYTSS